MPEYEINDGGEKFTVNANSHAEASAAVANYQCMNFTGKVILLIFLIVPVLCAKLVGIVFGLLGKIPIIGRIIQTILWAIACAIVGLIGLGGISAGAGNIQTILALGLVGGFAGGAFWFYLYHFHVVKHMGVMIFADILTRSFSIAFYGGIIGAIIGGIISKGEMMGVFIGVLIAFIAALIFYIKKTRQFSAEAAEIRGPIPGKLKAIFGIVALVLTGLGVTLGIIGDISVGIRDAADKKEREAALEAMIAKDPSMAIVRLTVPFEATVTSPIKGITSEMNRREVEIPEGASITVSYFFNDEYKAMIRHNNTPIEVEPKDFGSIEPK